MMSLLLQYNAQLEARTKIGGTPLHEASGRGQLAAVRSLLKANNDDDNHDHDHDDDGNGNDRFLLTVNADRDVRTDDGRNPLFLAAEFNHAAVVEHLLAAGSTVDCQRLDGATPLHEAASKGFGDVVRILLRGGADRSIRSRWGTPADVAKLHHFRHIIEILEESKDAGERPHGGLTWGPQPKDWKESGHQWQACGPARQCRLCTVFGACDSEDLCRRCSTIYL